VLGLAVDGAGAALVTGYTTGAAGFPVTQWAFQTVFGGDATDAFAAKLAPDGSLLYATYLGGSGAERGLAIAFGADGTAVVAGQTTGGIRQIVTEGAFQDEVGGALDGFVGRLDPFGARLVYFSYLGGSGVDRARAVDVAADGAAVVVGSTRSRDFPTTPGAAMRTLAGPCAKDLCGEGFVSTVAANGTALVQSTLVGGDLEDRLSGVALDSDAVIAGGLALSPAWLGRPAGGFPSDGVVVRLGPPSGDLLMVTSTSDAADAVPGDGRCDAGPGIGCTLRAAVMEADELPGEQTIQVPAGDFHLSIPPVLDADGATGDLDPSSALQIVGAGSGLTVIHGLAGAGGDRVMEVGSAATVRLSQLTITGGETINGGGLKVDGELVLEDAEVRGNRANYGGGILVSGRARIHGSTITENDAGYGGGIDGTGSSELVVSASVITKNGHGYGAGVNAAGSLDMSDTTVSMNTGGFGGGLQLVGDAPKVVRSSAIVGNVATRGGGLNVAGANVTLVNSTVSGNEGIGGGIHNQGSITITYSTLAFNASSAWGAVIYNTARLVVGSSILGPATQAAVCENSGGSILSLGHNLDRDGSCQLAGPGDLAAVDPLLAPLQLAGGITPVHPLEAGSPAIDHGDGAICPPVDQRGVPRPAGSGCDSGAVEAGTP
jgi:hypothetical protein